MNILSNTISGEHKDLILEKTFNDIFNHIKYLYGPGATDNFIIKEGAPYFTRDGKEVFDTFRYDNDVSMMLHTIMRDAIDLQSERAGDGTTTLIIFSILLYRSVKDLMTTSTISMFELRKSFNRVIDLLKAEIVKQAKEIKVSDEDFRNMVYTTTQDERLTDEILNVMKDANKDTFINIIKNGFSDEIKVEHVETPVIKGELVYSFLDTEGKFNYPAIFYIKGQLELVDDRVIEKFITGWNLPVNRDTIIICNGTTSNTRSILKTVKERYIKICNTNGKAFPINNLHIFKAGSSYFANEEISTDITTILFEKEYCSLFEKHSFEEYIKTLCFNDAELDALEIPNVFDYPTGYADEFAKMATITYKVDYNPSEGIRVDNVLGEKAKERMEALKKEIKEEQSEVKKAALSSRYRGVFGSFINVEIGAKLLKDSQRDYELMKDAIISGQHALNSGIICRNSLIELLSCARTVTNSILNDTTDSFGSTDIKALNMIETATVNTLKELFITRFGADKYRDIGPEVLKSEIFMMMDNSKYLDIYIDNSPLVANICYDKGEETKTHPVIEPVDIITNILDLSKGIAIDFAMSKFIIVGKNDNINNYI